MAIQNLAQNFLKNRTSTTPFGSGEESPIISAARGFLSGPRERFGSIAESIRTRSLTPLIESFKKQWKDYTSLSIEEQAMFLVGSFGTTGFKGPKPGMVKPITSVQKLVNAITEAKPVRKAQEALYRAERAKRFARVANITTKGEAGFHAQLGQLKGELPKAKFDAVRGKFEQADIDEFFDLVENTKGLLSLEKVSSKGGLAKMLEGQVPTRGEIELLKQTFPDELINAILQKRPLSTRILEGIGKALNIPRTIMASFDLSAPLRQGIFTIGRPKQFAPAFKDMFKYAFSEKAYDGLQDSLRARPNYKLMRQAKLALTDLGSSLTSREEAIMSSLPERIPLVGRVIRGSNRAYTGFLNKLRADVFDDIVIKARVAGKELTENEIEDIGRFINAATGRGNLGALEKAAVPLNTIFFSPRLIASRLNLLNPYFYVTLSPIARKEALKSLFGFTGIMGTVLGLAKLGGADIGGDSRSADFGKIKVGNTRYDVLGGFQQYIKLASQLLSGEIKSSTTGRTITLGEGYKPLTRKDIALRFFENKESPIASFITSLAQGTTPIGEDVDIPTEILNRFVPMVAQDMYDLSQERGAEGIMMGLPAIFGVGSQTYGNQELATGQNILGEDTAQIRPTQGMAEKLRELIVGQRPLGASKTFSVEAYFDQLSNLPKDEAAEIFDKISDANPDLAKKIMEVVKDRELGITVEDRDLKAKGVASGDRALAIKRELDKRTPEEKAVLWDDYTKKGIITKEVARQLNLLLQNK